MTTQVRVLIVDDERLARDELRRHAARHAGIDVVGEAADGAAAVESIVALSPDIVFLDIQMPELDGFEVLQALPDAERPVTVFVTAYDEFALRAFEARAVDYLLKPFDDERFDAALARALVHVHEHERSTPVDELLTDVARAGRRPTRIAARRGRRFHLLEVADIERLEASRNYVLVHAGGAEYLTRSTLGSLADRLDPDQFLRIHRGHIVRLDAVAIVERTPPGDVAVRMHDGALLPVARSRRVEVRERLRSL